MLAAVPARRRSSCMGLARNRRVPGPRAVPGHRARVRARASRPSPCSPRRPRPAARAAAAAARPRPLRALAVRLGRARGRARRARRRAGRSRSTDAAAPRRDRGGARPVHRRSSRASTAASWTSATSRRETRGRPARMRFSGPAGRAGREGPARRLARPRPQGEPVHGPGQPAPVPLLHDAGRRRRARDRRCSGWRWWSACPCFGTNTFGLERRGIALLMGFPVERWRILVAKNLASIDPAPARPCSPWPWPARSSRPHLLPAAPPSRVVRPPDLGGRGQLRVDPVPAARARAGPQRRARRAAAASGTLAMSALLLVAGPVVARALRAPGLAARLLLRCRGCGWSRLPLALAGAGAVYAMLVAGADEAPAAARARGPRAHPVVAGVKRPDRRRSLGLGWSAARWRAR